MGLLDWYDTNKDGHYSAAEIDRYQLDHAEYPGMFERASDVYSSDPWDEEYGSGKRKKHKKSGSLSDYEDSSYDYLVDDDDDWDEDEDDDWDDDDDFDDEDDDW